VLPGKCFSKRPSEATCPLQAIEEKMQPIQQDVSELSPVANIEGPGNRTDDRSPLLEPATQAMPAASWHAMDAEKSQGRATPGSRKPAALREPLAEISAPGAHPVTPTPTQIVPPHHGANDSHLENVAPHTPATNKGSCPSIERGRRASAAVTLNPTEAFPR
jgi:hypothetical protein